MRRILAKLFVFCFVITAISTTFHAPCHNSAHAQDLLIDSELGGFDDVDAPDQENPVTFGAMFTMKPDSQEGTLFIHARIATGWHLYSVTQPKGGPLRLVINSLSDEVTIQSGFVPDIEPHVIEDSEAFNVNVEEHVEDTTWAAPIRVEEGMDFEDLEIELSINGQTCVTNPDGSPGVCIQLSETVFAPYNGETESAAPPLEENFTPKSHLEISGSVTSNGPIKPGSKVTVRITAAPTGDFHVYPYSNVGSVSSATFIALTKTNGWSVGKTEASNEPETKDVSGELVSYHHQPVTWTTDVTIPSDAGEKTYTLGGLFGVQTCTDNGCDPPEGMQFSAEINLTKVVTEVPLKFGSGPTDDEIRSAVDKLAELAGIDLAPPSEKKKEVIVDSPELIEEMAKLYDAEEKIQYETIREPVKMTIFTAMFFMFLGGMILNLMPCVFPVLGIKVMGFVEQAGSDAKKVRMHGLAFAAGLVASMWALAGTILVLKTWFGQDVNWGQQMGNPYFVGGIILLLFILGLNMAGVFEIGTSLTRVGGNVQGKKGYSASFFSGILTTLIATPCSGPFLGAAMGYTFAQTNPVAMMLFTIFGLGIAAPYLFLSFFPSLIQRLPRPGAWMETFKVTMSFALFATAVFFMKTFGGQTGLDGMWWLAMGMVVIGLALFFYGKFSLPHLPIKKRTIYGYAMPILIGCVGLYMTYDAAGKTAPKLAHVPGEGLPWMEWNPGKVQHVLNTKQKPIWVDYTADW